MRATYGPLGWLLMLLVYIPSQAQSPWATARVTKVPFHKPVTCLLKDCTGFLWLGTREGLYRYDGYEFALINTLPGNGLRLASPQVNALLEDSLQHLWVATDNGVTVFNPARDQYRHL